MKKTLLGIVGMMMTAISVFADFTPPTAEQLTAAANNPTAMAALLVGASSEQAAQVIKAVVVQISAMGLSASAQAASIGSVITVSFSAVPAGAAPMLAANLGTACGSSLAISANPVVVSSIQSSIATAGGSGGATMAQTFGTSYTEAKAASQGAKDSAPPVAKGYDGQQ